MSEQKEPMIGKENRPSAIDYNAPVSGMKLGDVVSAVGTHLSEQLKSFPEHIKPELYKPEYWKPEFWKPEFWKPEYFKPEAFKPPVEKEFKPEGGISEQLVERVVVRVLEALKQRGTIK